MGGRTFESEGSNLAVDPNDAENPIVGRSRRQGL